MVHINNNKKLKNKKIGVRGSLKHQRRSISARRSLTWTRSVCPAALAAQAYALKEENDSLRWQLDAYRNEVELLKQEKEQLSRTEESLTKDRQVQFLQQTMRGMQQVLRRCSEGQGRTLGAGRVGSWRGRRGGREAERGDQQRPGEVSWEERVWGEATQRCSLLYQ